MPSLATVGDGYDNARTEPFWSKMQTELLDRKKWNTRTELANEIFQYLKISTTGNAATPSSDTSPRSSMKTPRTTTTRLTATTHGSP